MGEHGVSTQALLRMVCKDFRRWTETVRVFLRLAEVDAHSMYMSLIFCLQGSHIGLRKIAGSVLESLATRAVQNCSFRSIVAAILAYSTLPVADTQENRRHRIVEAWSLTCGDRPVPHGEVVTSSSEMQKKMSRATHLIQVTSDVLNR